MDVAAHALWAAAGGVWALRKRVIGRADLAATVALAAVPDLVQFLPVLAWVLLGHGSWHVIPAFAMALPGHEPDLPHWVGVMSYQLHCFAHSGVIVGVATVTLTIGLGRMWWPLLGWWSHVVIDMFTHSADYHPATVLYPLNDWTFDGVSWTQPWLLVANYLLLLLAWVALWRGGRRLH